MSLKPHRLISVLALLAFGHGALAEAVVPIRAIRAQHMVTADDLQVVDQNVPGAVTDPAELIGKEARITLYPGRPILKGQVGAPALVERNQTVRMTFSHGPLTISADGRVLDRGGAGESVRVMNLSSRQIVSGTVGADGSVTVVK
ncbi:flagellar basal body P-ring formation chaperone FlgA [Amaricoccus tamworthensis]|uniref:flagellar basal body P-ring formation chaperone FlgA n=1 Tax=Amaricoccus tamworthensis TaxID=57002 RepID=UPI003C7ACAA5